MDGWHSRRTRIDLCLLFFTWTCLVSTLNPLKTGGDRADVKPGGRATEVSRGGAFTDIPWSEPFHPRIVGRQDRIRGACN